MKHSSIIISEKEEIVKVRNAPAKKARRGEGKPTRGRAYFLGKREGKPLYFSGRVCYNAIWINL